MVTRLLLTPSRLNCSRSATVRRCRPKVAESSDDTSIGGWRARALRRHRPTGSAALFQRVAARSRPRALHLLRTASAQVSFSSISFRFVVCRSSCTQKSARGAPLREPRPATRSQGCRGGLLHCARGGPEGQGTRRTCTHTIKLRVDYCGTHYGVVNCNDLQRS